MGSAYEAIGLAENTAEPPEETKNRAENNGAVVEQTAQNVENRNETCSGKYGWSIKEIILISIFMPLMNTQIFFSKITTTPSCLQLSNHLAEKI
ncbi:Solute carrier family 12 member [Dirofilaria immitis]